MVCNDKLLRKERKDAGISELVLKIIVARALTGMGSVVHMTTVASSAGTIV